MGQCGDGNDDLVSSYSSAMRDSSIRRQDRLDPAVYLLVKQVRRVSQSIGIFS